MGNDTKITNEIEEAITTEIKELESESLGDAILKRYAHLQINDETQIPAPQVLLRIGGEIISTEGNITTVSGPSKSGKTAFTSVLIAGCIADTDYDGFPDVDIKRSQGKAVLHFDTEQARHRHKTNLLSTLRRARLDSCPDNFLSYNIRELELSQFQVTTTEICQAAFEKFGGIHMIVIDGGADYIRDPNEPTQSNNLVKWLEDLSIKFSTSVMVIVHVNPGSDKERGHLGSQLQRKSESVLTVKTQGDVSYLEPKFLRMAGKGQIPLIQFQYSKEAGYHVYCGVHTRQSASDEKKINELEGIAQRVFAPPSSFGYKEAIERIMAHSKKKEAYAKGIFKELNVHGLITQGEDKYWRILID